MYACLYVCLCACMCTKSLLPHHCTHILYFTEQIFMPHCKYQPHSHYARRIYRSNILQMCSKTQVNALSTSHGFAMHVLTTDITLKCKIYATYANNFICTEHSYVNIYTSYELTTINNVTRNTGIHTFYTTGICPRTNMSAKLHMYVSLYYYCSLHTSGKQQTANLNYHAISIYVPATNMPL